ncbi:MAG TPA: HAMP domain-containing sensor histidine kinase [Gemmatimonadaceae bacterium]|nr:HAMP domain-containing sensor histidine kinase [Gemmatimonadaceae bacterium]
MTFRARLMIAFGVVALAPLVVIAVGVRREMDRRLTAQDERRAAALAAVASADLARGGVSIGDRLSSLVAALDDDNRFRLAVLQGDAAGRAYVLDLAGREMRLTGLSMLQIQDSSGRILSSGHFRNEYDRLEPDLPVLLASVRRAALVHARTPDGPMLVLARVDSVRLAGRRFAVVGGVQVDSAFLGRLAPGADFSMALALAGGDSIRSGGEVQGESHAMVVSRIDIPYIAAGAGGARGVETASLTLSRSTAALDALERSVDLWFMAAIATTAAVALLASTWLAARVSRPLRELAEQTSRVDLDRLDVDFSAGRDDEIGALSRLLGAMTRRLRASAARERDAERRAAVGDLARQVNHDVKNGLAPIRHVLRHLAQVERDEPARLATVFAERRPTLDASVEYLDTLARNYARLSPRLDVAPCDVNAIARTVAAGASAPRSATIALALADGLPEVRADALVLRRILENLVTNACDALDGRGGTVTIGTAAAAGGVELSVTDTGSGMTCEQLNRAFDDFYTTKPAGTGLGLSIVRRLVADLGGALRVDTEPGNGTRVLVTLPPNEIRGEPARSVARP